MGTTVTTNLALIKPDQAESIKANMPTFAGWAAQNGLNCDKIDSLFRATTHNPTTLWTSSGSNPTLGTGGSVAGKCIRVLPRMVIGHFSIFTGTAAFTPGTGTYRINTPATVAPELDGYAAYVAIGKAILLDADNVATSQNMTVYYDITNDYLFLRPSAGGTWTPTTPITLAVNDRLSGYFMYPTADS